MSSFFNIPGVITFLCHTHSIDLNDVKNSLENFDLNNFSDVDRRMAAYISNQFQSEQLFDEFGLGEDSEDLEHETLDLFDNGNIDSVIFDSVDPSNLTELSTASDNVVSDDDDFVFDEPCVKKYKYIDDTPREKWIKAFGVWTRQSDSVVISNEFLALPNKQTMKSMEKLYRFVGPSCRYLREWAKREIKAGGSAASFRLINNLVFEKFLKRRSVHGSVNDLMLRKWAVQIRNSLDPSFDFRASVGWVLNFKRTHNLVSRAITHKVSRNYDNSQERLMKDAKKFIAEVKQLIVEKKFSKNEIVNCDQSRFDKEPRSYRTLEPKGGKRVLVSVGSMNATTHSMMIMPFIDGSGGICEQLYLLTQEKGGLFPQIRVPIIPSNIRAFAGSSAIMNASDMKTFLCLLIENFISKGIPKILLILDSWPVNKNSNLWNDLLKEYNSKIELYKKVIPAGCTGLIQPLDVYFFRPYKSFVKHIVHSLVVENKVFQRNNMLGLHSFVHFQFCAPRFRNLIVYAFYKAGYFEEKPGPFQTPTQYCFDPNELKKCSDISCDSAGDIRCAHCEECFCFEHSVLSNPHINCNTDN